MALLGDSVDDPRTMAVLQLGAAMLANGGPSRQPTNFGVGLFNGLQAYQQAIAQAKRLQIADEESRQRGEERAAIIEQRRQQAAALEQAAQAKAERQAYLNSLTVPQYQQGATVMRPETMAPTMPRFDPLRYLALGGDPKEAEFIANAPNLGRPEVARTVEAADESGRKVTRQFDRYGNPVGAAIPGYTAPVQVDQGDRKTFVIPQAGASLPVGMSPSERDSSARGWAGLKIQQQNADTSAYRATKEGPADTKKQEIEAQKEAARGDADRLIASLRSAYDGLDQGGGITSTEKGSLSNLAAGVASSGVGQFAGRMVGTQNQSLRNQIAQTRPLLMSAIMRSMGMSARQLDSNVELKLWLATATDPTLDKQANLQALRNLENLIGSGSVGGGAESSAPAPGSPARVIDFSSLPK